MTNVKYKRLIGADDKQQIRNVVLKNLKKFLNINQGRDVVITMLPETKWIVEKEIPRLIKERNFKSKVTCLFYENLDGRYSAEQKIFKDLSKKGPKNCSMLYTKTNMPIPEAIDRIFKCPIFFWGDYCCEYNNNQIIDHLSHDLHPNSVVFLTYTIKKKLPKITCPSVTKETEKLLHDITKISKSELIEFKVYRANRFNMVFFGFDNFDYSCGNGSIYNLYHNITKKYKRKKSIPEIRVLKNIPEEQIKNIVL